MRVPATAAGARRLRTQPGTRGFQLYELLVVLAILSVVGTMGIPRVLAAAPTGYLAEQLGWEGFFIACTMMALPGMFLLLKFAPWTDHSSAVV